MMIYNILQLQTQQLGKIAFQMIVDAKGKASFSKSVASKVRFYQK